MKMRILLSGLAASAVLLAAGSALPGGPHTRTTNDQIVDFDQKTGELWAFPVAQGLTIYLHDHRTHHALADLSRFLPPDPCLPIAEAWNATVAYDGAHRVQSRFIFEVLLVLMADFQCRATVTSSTNGTPQPIVVITPTAN
jgi:hypothetical protein